jgi:hypothetical protein
MKNAIEIFTKNEIDLFELKQNVLNVANHHFDRNKLALNYLNRLHEI